MNKHQTIESIAIMRNRDEAPVVQYQTEDGPMYGVHPDVRGLSIAAFTSFGEMYVLAGFECDGESEADWDRARGVLARIQHHLDAGGTLDLENHWVFVRTIYGTPAWENEFYEHMESHVNAGGSMEEFLSM